MNKIISLDSLQRLVVNPLKRLIDKKAETWDDLKEKPDQDDALSLIAEVGLMEPVVASDGTIYTDKNGYILTLN